MKDTGDLVSSLKHVQESALSISSEEDKIKNKLVQELKKKLNEISERKCAGCEINHPSQRQHECCMKSISEKIEEFYNDLIESFDIEQFIQEQHAIPSIAYDIFLKFVANQNSLVEAITENSL